MRDELPQPPFPEDAIPAAHRFEPRVMVDWLAPLQLIGTGVQVLLSTLFGAYSDKREMQAALMRTSEPDGDYSDQKEIWFDYIADLGDGFHPTYAMAWLLAKDRLRPALAPGMQQAPEGWENGLPRGRFLIMGGDQVYPTASASEYQHRLIGPYGAALPYSRKDWPHLYAIPGNHDWYDGLTSFLRIFCQRPTGKESPLECRWIGAWEPRQRRSYFALKLPANWWLWGTDIQLSSDIDRPQLEYFFEEIVPQMKAEQEKTGIEPRVILVTATPSWIFRGADPTPDPGASDEEEGEQPVGIRRSIVDPKAFDSLAHFEGLIRESGARVALVLSGDLHHFCHYVQVNKDEQGHRTHRITSGGGGAYLFPTHQMPRDISLPERGHVASYEHKAQKEEEVRYQLRNTTFPAEKDSRRLGRGVWLLPLRNWRFSALLGGVYALFGWTSPYVSGVLLGLVILFGAYAFANSQTSFRRNLQRVLGVLHGGAHILMAQAVASWVYDWLPPEDLQSRFRTAIFHALPYAATMLVIGGLVGSILFTLYLLVSSKFTGAHTNEVFSSQKIPDYKNFIRLRIDANGDLTLYPIGVEKVPRAWKANPDATGPEGEAPWWNPAKGEVESRLIERPAKIA
ncbi:MAG TPA: hypothetical protein VJ725_30405 [Thermoanaerobaculia bacterium]|nr:hypothetical protein [Thermoanaerobaculia bacterium]